ncbi:conidiation-specific protein 6 [Hypoxylon sp. NC1633]|nr:conidiation-specific protein 6 [Hypoxylon sp. NC1633]
MPTDAQIAGGHKANLKNPTTSKDSKEHSKQVLENEFGSKEASKTGASNTGTSNTGDDNGKNPNNVAGGLKATINNPRVSDEAKESAKERLDDM